MEIKKLTGSALYEMLETGYKNLLAHYKAINDLNVFPVPDGDTGTNMKLTYQNGLKSVTDKENMAGIIADEFARGMLFGARGNSGVLTSQYFRGFADAIKDKNTITVRDFVFAMRSGYHNAYKACVDVAEGTILTVAREGIENVRFLGNETFSEFLEKVIEAMSISLDNTPNLLPILKENGVIDSGGKGLLTIFEGFICYFTGEEIIEVEEEVEEIKKNAKEEATDYSAFNENSVLEYGYCTEFLLQLQHAKTDIPNFKIDEFIAFMQSHGDSLVCFQTGTIIKVHVHTKKPYEVIEYAQRFGEFLTFKMENMALQHNNLIKEEENKIQERKKIAFIAIAQGDGIIDLFKNLNCDLVINGGQTMNTSVAEMVDAFKYVNADEIILLPNESNMCKAAIQASELYKDSIVKVIETKTLQEGYYILSCRLGLDENDKNLYKILNSSLKNVTSASVFKSGKDANVNAAIAKKGSYVEAIKHKLVGYNASRAKALNELLDKIPNLSSKDIMFVMYGQMLSQEDVEEIFAIISEKYPLLEVNMIEGKQDVYDLLIGVI